METSAAGRADSLQKYHLINPQKQPDLTIEKRAQSRHIRFESEPPQNVSI